MAGSDAFEPLAGRVAPLLRLVVPAVRDLVAGSDAAGRDTPLLGVPAALDLVAHW